MKFVMNENKEVVLVYPDGKQRSTDSLVAIMGYEILTRLANLEKIAASMGGMKITQKEPDASDKEPKKS